MSEILTINLKRHRYRIGKPDGRIGRRLASGKPYEHRLLDQIRRRRLTGSALDVGAHVGNHTLYLAIVCELTVHAVEADPDRYAQLQANLDLNPSARRRTTTYPYAAGAGTGTGQWRPGEYMALDVGGGDVPVRAVDDLMDLDDLALVKIDIEGMEPEALEGMRGHLERCRPVVYSEVHTEAAHAAQAAVLEPLGYRQTAPVRMGSRMEVWEC